MTDIDTIDPKQALMQLRYDDLIDWSHLSVQGRTLKGDFRPNRRFVRAMPITDPVQVLRAFDSSAIKSVWDEVYNTPTWSTEKFNKESFSDEQKPAGCGHCVQFP